MTRGDNITDAQEARLFQLMRDARHMEEIAYRSPSGADVAGAPLYAITHEFWTMVWRGRDPEEAIAYCRARWTTYCAENNAKIGAAPKVRRGPYEGASVIHYRWTSPDRFDATVPHLRQMIRFVMEADQ